MKKKKRFKVWPILLCLLVLLASMLAFFMHFGGFSTGENGTPEEFATYAGTVADISIPEDTQIIALGEATHGNVEFQQLRLDVFKHMVDNYGVRAFVLEGDFGGCEQVNRYIHGGGGTTREAAAAIGFAIYRTEEMENLISYMRQYNESALEGEDLRFYGIDMQRYYYSYTFLVEACKELGVDTSDLAKLVEGEEWHNDYDTNGRMQIITAVKNELESIENSEQAIHFAAILLQYLEIQSGAGQDYGTLRDRFMAENTQWVAQQEQQAGNERIFISGHNGHVAKWGSYDSMGKLLADVLGESYYVIGTDFYKTTCNMPNQSSGKRTNQVFYSHDPLAKTSQMAGLDISWLDFSKAAESPELEEMISQYTFMGSLGEGYGWYMRFLPPSYRIFQPPATLYDGMIFVADATPITVLDAY